MAEPSCSINWCNESSFFASDFSPEPKTNLLSLSLSLSPLLSIRRGTLVLFLAVSSYRLCTMAKVVWEKQPIYCGQPINQPANLGIVAVEEEGMKDDQRTTNENWVTPSKLFSAPSSKRNNYLKATVWRKLENEIENERYRIYEHVVFFNFETGNFLLASKFPVYEFPIPSLVLLRVYLMCFLASWEYP